MRMGRLSDRLHHTCTLAGLALCTLGPAWLTLWAGQQAWIAFWAERDLLAFFLMVLTGLTGVVGWRAAQLFGRLYLGRTTSRLAARDLRNTMANSIFLFLGGEWKE